MRWRDDTWVRPFFWRYRKALAAALGLGVLASLFSAGLMFVSGFLISLSATPPDTFLDIMVPLAFVQIFGLGKPILTYFERLSSHDWVLHMTSDLRLRLYRALEADAMFLRSTRRAGDVLGLLDEDIGHLQNLYLRTVFPTVVAWVVFAVVVVLAGCFSPPLAAALAGLLAVELVVVPLVGVLVNAARRAQAKQLRNDRYAQLTDDVLGVSDWVFSGRGEDYRGAYRDVDARLRRLTHAENAYNRVRDLLVQLLFGAVATLLVVWAGASFGAGSSSWPALANWIAAVAIAFFPLIDAFAPVPDAVVDAVSYTDSVERLNELPEPGDDAHADAPRPQAPLDLRADEVVFSYPGTQRQVLRGLTLRVPQGQKVAILGRSGAGKSTLASLVRGDLVPDAGSVTLGGVPTATLGEEASRYVGVIQQQTYLFNATLLDNLRVGRADATVTEVWQAVAEVGLLDMVERLPEGLGTMVDEAGLRFSGGERHRIALARVLLQDVPVVVLDEPTVGLDPTTERALLKTLFDVLADKTVIMITHHLAGVSLVDRVVFVEDGRVQLDGTPAQLQAESPRYRELLDFDAGL